MGPRLVFKRTRAGAVVLSGALVGAFSAPAQAAIDIATAVKIGEGVKVAYDMLNGVISGDPALPSIEAAKVAIIEEIRAVQQEALANDVEYVVRQYAFVVRNNLPKSDPLTSIVVDRSLNTWVATKNYVRDQTAARAYRVAPGFNAVVAVRFGLLSRFYPEDSVGFDEIGFESQQVNYNLVGARNTFCPQSGAQLNTVTGKKLLGVIGRTTTLTSSCVWDSYERRSVTFFPASSTCYEEPFFNHCFDYYDWCESKGHELLTMVDNDPVAHVVRQALLGGATTRYWAVRDPACTNSDAHVWGP